MANPHVSALLVTTARGGGREGELPSGLPIQLPCYQSLMGHSGEGMGGQNANLNANGKVPI